MPRVPRLDFDRNDDAGNFFTAKVDVVNFSVVFDFARKVLGLNDVFLEGAFKYWVFVTPGKDDGRLDEERLMDNPGA